MQSNPESIKITKIIHFQDKNGPLVFANFENCLKIQPKCKLAIFDLDDTLTVTVVSGSFTKENANCKLKFKEIPNKLQELVFRGFRIIIVTNQMGISKEHISIEDFTKKIGKLSDAVKVPFMVLVSVKDDEFRKPAIGSFLFILREIKKNGSNSKREKLNNLTNMCKKDDKFSNSSNLSKCSDDLKTTLTDTKSTKNIVSKFKSKPFKPDPNFYVSFEGDENFALEADIDIQSFFCGDAAGRNESDSSDFSNTDLLFAINCKLNFYLPEQIFQNKEQSPLSKNPKFLLIIKPPLEKHLYESLINVSKLRDSGKSNTFVMLVGPASSGKTFLCKKVFRSGFKIVSYVNLLEA